MRAKRVGIVVVLLILAVLIVGVAGCDLSAVLLPTAAPWMFEVDLAAWMSVL